MPQKLAAIGEKLKKSGTLGVALIIVVLGVVLLALPTEKAPEPAPPPEPEVAVTQSLAETEQRIAEALAQIDGAGRVTVVLTLKSDGETIIAEDWSLIERADGAREEKTDAVLVGSGGSVQNPVILGRGYPEYRGALVVAEGASNPETRLQLLNAVAALTGLGADKVTVAVMRRNN